MLKVRVCALASGEQLPLLVDPVTRLPDAELTWYITSELRQRGLKFKTMRRLCGSLAQALDFLDQRGIDIAARAASGDFLSRHELAAYSAFCRVGENGQTLNVEYAGSRYYCLLDYILWIAEPIIARAEPRERKTALELAQTRFEKRFARNAPPNANVSAVAPGEREGLRPEDRTLLLEVIRPGSPQNPFSPQCQARNFVFVSLLLELPFRAGEILGLKRQDFDTRSSPMSVTIERRHDDPRDPRIDKPVAKTRGRMHLLTGEVEATVRDWLKVKIVNRDVYPEARKHEFAFPNRKGGPWALRSARDVFKRIRLTHPQFETLCAHVLRHDWNERFVDAALARGRGADDRQMEQKYANGWTEESQMPARYSKRAIRDAANRRILELSERASSGGNKS